MLDPADCPEFDDSNPETIEQILSWGGVKLDFDEAPIRIGGRPGQPRKKMDPYWTFYWEKGFMATPLFERSDEKWARMHAALFIYLWCNRIPTSLADPLCCSFVISRKRWEEERATRT